MRVLPFIASPFCFFTWYNLIVSFSIDKHSKHIRAFWARKVVGTYEKRVPGRYTDRPVWMTNDSLPRAVIPVQNAPWMKLFSWCKEKAGSRWWELKAIKRPRIIFLVNINVINGKRHILVDNRPFCISWSRDQLSISTKTVRFWKNLLARAERAY